MSTARGRGNRGVRGRPGPPLPRGGGTRQLRTDAAPSHRVFQPGKRHMELIPSVSRSSGLDKDGDALRDPKVQEEYRAFIQTKVDDYWKKYPLRSVPGSGDPDLEAARHRKEMEGNLLILFRKLREGLLSTQRKDAFAREVYETSLHLSVLFRTPVQTTSTLSHLFPAFYVPDGRPTVSPPRSGDTSSSATTTRSARHEASVTQPSVDSPSPPPTALTSTLISLLHHLDASYPSQASFQTHLRQLHPALQELLRAPKPAGHGPGSDTSSSSPQPEPASQPADRRVRRSTLAAADSASPHGWVAALARCLRRRDYARLESLTRRETFVRFVDGEPGRTREDRGEPVVPSLAAEAVQVLVNSLVEKARVPTWNIIRSAYREVNLRATPTGAPAEDSTAAWLVRSLVLRSNTVGEAGRNPPYHDIAQGWLEERGAKQEARKKEGEGMEGRWILVKA
ncbi:hypothetical protein C8Q77DRAFT_1122814 [Trametes polyzona]|nr:hypothetical protein C8Q77DRAFT_1122814 [Trametes polyzona]